MPYTGEFDKEFITELKAMVPAPPVDDTPLKTVASEQEYQDILEQQQTESHVVKNQDVANCRKNYLTSEIPVRPCTDDCPKRSTCRDFCRPPLSNKLRRRNSRRLRNVKPAWVLRPGLAFLFEI